MSTASGMSATRRAIVLAGIVLFVLASAAHAVTGREHWPFSAYSMYSKPKANYRSEKLIVVAVDPAGDEQSLLGRHQLWPFNRAKIDTVLTKIHRTGTAEQLRDAFIAITREIDDLPANRGAVAMRLYRGEWEMYPDAHNLNAPEVWDRLLEVSLGQ